MQVVNLRICCPECKAEITHQVNLWTGEHKVLADFTSFKPGYPRLVALVNHYKMLKGYDKMPTWNGAHFARAAASAKRLLYFFRKLEDPLDVSKEYLTETDQMCKKQGWNNWTIEKAVMMAPDWLLKKQDGK